MTDRAERCGDCRWRGPYGQCRLRGPIAVKGRHFMETEWPTTNDEDWCGEFAPRDQRVTDNRDQWEKGPR